MLHIPTFITTLITVFFAELGDKTQLATLAIASESKSKWSVLAGSIAGLSLSCIIAVLIGSWLSKMVPPHWIKRSAGLLFIILGVFYLRASFITKN